MRPGERRQFGRVRFSGLDGNENVHDRHKTTHSETARREDVARGQSFAHQTGLHRPRPGFAPELQSTVRADEIVMASQELDVAAELLRATGVAWRPPTQVRRALTNREVESLDKGRIQGLGILRFEKSVLQATRRADLDSPLDSDDAIIPPSLEHLTIDARGTEEANERTEVKLEAIRHDQWDSDEAPPEDDVVEYGLGVPIGAAADEATRPQAGTHRDRRKEPHRPALAADERVQLIGLKLNALEVPQHFPVEALCRDRRPLEPACHGVAGATRETGRRGNAHALDSQARYLVELLPSTTKTAVGRACIRADGSPAYLATVTPSATRLGGKPAVATDGGAPLSKILAPWLGASLVLVGPHRSSVAALKTAVSPTISST